MIKTLYYQDNTNAHKIYVKPSNGPGISIRKEGKQIKFGILGFDWSTKELNKGAAPITKSRAERILEFSNF